MEKERPHYVIDGILVTVDPNLNQEAALAYARSVIATRTECCLSVDTAGSKPERRSTHVFYHDLPTSLMLIESEKPYKSITLSNGKRLRVYPYRNTTIDDIDDVVLECTKNHAESVLSIDKDDDKWYWED